MADEKNVVKGKETKENKFVAFCKRLPGNIARPFKNMWHELRKVTWPTKQDLINYTLIVLAFLVFMGVVIGLLDLGSVALIRAI
ncbi:MAG: preprotein translocase subunit SecE [Clostridia bacterium]|nr:preprotein translocase subunit SecE [Clostridia bacterium]